MPPPPPKRSASEFIDDTEEAIIHVKPSDNVYSYFMFVTPSEMHKEGGSFTMDTIMAWILAVLNFVMQGVLLYTVFNEVVVANQDWQESILKIEKPLGEAQQFLGSAPGKCNPGGSLCYMINGNLTCAPPTVQLTGRWAELDTDGNGIWTRTEVEKAKTELQCKYIVNPVEVFDVFINFLKSREKILWLHPDVKEGKAIHKEYFDFAMGDIIMCGYRTTDMCSNVLKRGFFDAPLKYQTAPRVGTTITSALKYCTELLEPGGTCERFLPSTYSVWKISSNDQCGDPSYSKFVYKNPGNGVAKSLLEVDYDAPQQFEKATITTFKIYKTIIIGMWLLTMSVEAKDIIIVLTWCYSFPDADQFGEDAVHQEETENGETLVTIQGITKLHRNCMVLITLLRTILTVVLTYVGVSFLLKQTGYIDLLMDAVTLVFIIEIANIIYAQALRPQIREQCENLQPMTVNKLSFGGALDELNKRPAVADLCWFIGIVILTIIIIETYTAQIVSALLDASQCACLGVGDRCIDAHKFSYDFWHDYWRYTIPKIFRAIDDLRAFSPAPAPGPAPA